MLIPAADELFSWAEERARARILRIRAAVPSKDAGECEEPDDEVVLMKDRSGRVIGFERLNFSLPESDSLRVALKIAPA